MFIIQFVAGNAELILVSLPVLAVGGVAMFHVRGRGKVTDALGGIFFATAALEIVLFFVAIPFLHK